MTLRAASGRIARWVLTAFTILVVSLVIVLVAVPRATGAVPLAVLSDSMSPTIRAGAVVAVRPVEPATLRTGDVITFQVQSGQPMLITHRIVGVTVGGNGIRFHTKGDANGGIDPEQVRPEQIRGKVWFKVPLLGHLTNKLDGSQRAWGVRLIGATFVGWALYLVGATGIDARRRVDSIGRPRRLTRHACVATRAWHSGWRRWWR